MMAAINTVGSNSSSSSLAAVKSPRHGGGGVDGVGSPQPRRASARSPWNQIVRGESEPIAAVPSSPSAAASAVAAVMELAIPAAAAAADSSCSSSSPPPSASSSPSLVEETGGGENSEGGGSGPNGGNVGKRSAWNKPSNGGAAAGEVGPVMGASWPALSESARASSAKSSSESLKGLSDGSPSVPASQGSGSTVSTTTTPSQKHAHPSPTTNHAGPSRQRSMRRSNSNVSSNGGVPQQQAPAGQAVEIASSNPSPKEHTQRSGFGSHSHGSGDHPQQRNSSRNRTGGPHPRGDGPHHYHHYGGRRDQDRGSHDWTHSRSFNGRDNHMQQPRVSPRMIRGPPPPPSPTHFIPQHLRPYPSIGFPELGHHVVYLAPPPPYVAPPLSPVFMGAPDPQLPSKIVNQIDYYFSSENLIKDIYLRQNMDDQGWVPIKLIAGFNKVLNLTDNIQLILDSVRMSTIVEVQGDKVRRRNDWLRWLVLPSAQFPTVSSPQTPGKSSHDMLAARVQGIVLEERNPNISSSGQGSYQPQMPNGDAADRSSSGRN